MSSEGCSGRGVANSVSILAPTYDHPALWKGISSMISEVAEQLPKATSPDAIVCSVGGGSMLTGTLLGCAEQGWDDGDINFLVR
jgi:L-serine/L-threonine ammonia-lyase